MRACSVLFVICCLVTIIIASGYTGVDVSVDTYISNFNCLQNEGFSFVIIRCFRSNGEPDSVSKFSHIHLF